jgi:regulator of vacuolar morphogenesis
VLGVKAQNTVKETAETRPLDDRGLLSLQQTYMDQQDSKLEGLTAAIRRQRALGEMIGEELRIHDELLDRLETSTDKTQSKLKEADKMARRL